MAKITEWRKNCPKSIFTNQIRALEADTFFVIRQNGPLAFSVQELTKREPFEVRLGDPHRCTCKWYRMAFDLCVHICWIILKKFSISVHNSISFQRGMSAQELDEYVYGIGKKCPRQQNTLKKPNKPDEPNLKPVRKRLTNGMDTCPICLDSYNLSDSLRTVVYCKYSCGNAMHTRCLSMLIRHREQENLIISGSSRKLRGDIIRCPLCRGNFNTASALKLEIQRATRQRFDEICTNKFLQIPGMDTYGTDE